MVDPKDNSKENTLSNIQIAKQVWDSELGHQLRYSPEALNSELKFPHSRLKDEPLASASQALAIVIDHLSGIGIDPELLQPLKLLSEAVSDRVHGRVNSFLGAPLTKDGETKPGGNYMYPTDALDKGKAAAAITLSGRSGMKKTRQDAARKLRISEDELNNFRLNLKKGNYKNDLAFFQYWYYVFSYEDRPPEIRQEVIRRIMESLRPTRSGYNDQRF